MQAVWKGNGTWNGHRDKEKFLNQQDNHKAIDKMVSRWMCGKIKYNMTLWLWRWKKIGELKLSEFVSSGDSRSLALLDDKEFTIINVERKDYDENKGIKIATSEDFEIEGEKVNKFHTTRQAIVGKFLNDAGEPTSLFNAVNAADASLKVKIFKRKSANGRDYYDLEQC